MHYVVKAASADANAKRFSFADRKTMDGGKAIAVKDEVFIFSSENADGAGLIARGIVTSVRRTPRRRNHAKVRTTPRVSIMVRRVAKIAGVSEPAAAFLRTFF